MNKNLAFVCALLTLTPCISVAKATNYDECILENISNAQTNAAVGAVKLACRSLFPEPEFVPIPVPTEKNPVAGTADDSATERKKFYLTQVSFKWDGEYIAAELINDSKHLVWDISYRYKENDCRSPTRAAVTLAQKVLNEKGFKAGSVDGRLGAGTRSAIAKFQEATNTLKVTNKLDDGFELVVGNGFEGGIEKNAMPLLNKYIGNPLLTYIAKKLFNSKIGDFHCGLRAFTKKAYEKMELKSTGMEFATEMIAKSSLLKLKITEVPTTLKISINPRKPHLKPFRDGFRHLKLMFTYSFLKLSWRFFC